MKSKILCILLVFSIIASLFWLTGCDLSIIQGPQGEKGDTGEAGPQGKPGNDGKTPFIGENGNWWIGNIDTGVKAEVSETEKYPFVLASSYGILPGYVDSDKLQNILNNEAIKNKTILFEDGTYVFSSSINLISNVTILGSSNTVFKLSESSDSTVLLNINGIDNVTIRNLFVIGDNTSRPTEKGERCGIWIEGSRSVNIENVDISGWDLYGLYSKTMSSYGTAEEGKFYKQLQILNSRFYNNYCGSYFDYRCEYTQTLNCVFGENYIGSINCGGNNLYTSCMWNSNSYGFILNNDGSNPAHGGCNSSTFNHNETAIQVNNCVNGWTFDACQVFYGKIKLTNSVGVIFNSNIWGSCHFYSSNPGNINKNLITNTYFLTDSSTILANNDGSTLVYCCLPDHIPEDGESADPKNAIEDADWTKKLHTASGIHPGASNCYFSNCTSPINANEKITNLYIVIYGATENRIVNGVNVWLVNGSTDTVEKRLVENENIKVSYSKNLGKYVLNVEINETYDFPVYFVAQATRENGVGIAYSYGSSNSEFLDTNEVAIGQKITPNSNIVAEFAVFTSDE